MNDQRPKLGALCDTHLHIFKSPERDPALPETRTKVPDFPLSKFLGECEPAGVRRMVFVQPSNYGFDNRCALDSVATVGIDRARAVISVDPDTITDAELDDMHARGARAVRVNYGYRESTPSISRQAIEHAQKLERKMAERGWHLEFLIPNWSLKELISAMAKLTCPFSVGHMGVFLAAGGVAQEGFDDFLRLHQQGKCWVKFSGVYRLSTDPTYADLAPLAQAFINNNPDRIIWGSDWPHLGSAHRVTYPQLLDLLEQWAPDTATQKKILVSNPATLFGFGD